MNKPDSQATPLPPSQPEQNRERPVVLCIGSTIIDRKGQQERTRLTATEAVAGSLELGSDLTQTRTLES